jgi:hypothetical protein
VFFVALNITCGFAPARVAMPTQVLGAIEVSGLSSTGRNQPMARPDSDVVIYHNPACGTSRKVLGMIRDAGEEPRVIEYLKTPPSRAELLDPRGVRLCRPAERVQEVLPAH